MQNVNRIENGRIKTDLFVDFDENILNKQKSEQSAFLNGIAPFIKRDKFYYVSDGGKVVCVFCVDSNYIGTPKRKDISTFKSAFNK